GGREGDGLVAGAGAHRPGVAVASQVAAFLEGGVGGAPRVARADALELGPDLLPGRAPLGAAGRAGGAEVRAQEAQPLAARNAEVAPVQLRELGPCPRAERPAAQARALERDHHELALA